MSFESIDIEWSLEYCLSCDKQVSCGAYCSEACRLAEYEIANSGSESSSPTTPHGAGSWPMTKLSNGFSLQPAFEFSAFKAYGNTPTPKPSSAAYIPRPQSSPVAFSKPILTPSSSQSSLFSMQSTTSSQASASEQPQLSEEARRELRAYANCFDQSRYQRRQSK